MVKAYQLFYDMQSRAKVEPVAEPVDTSAVVQPYFESYWMATLPIPEKGRMGVFSPEFRRKARMPLSRMVARSVLTKAQVFYITGMTYEMNVWQHGAMMHPHFFKKSFIVLEEAGLARILRQDSVSIFCNYFLMNVELWHEFREEWLLPVMRAMDKHKDIVDQPCNYKSSSGHKTEQIQKSTGYPFYTYRPFICERLIGSFVVDKKLTHEICRLM
jgi:hypothetical protein